MAVATPAARPTSPQGVGSTAFESILLTGMLVTTHLIGAAVVVALSVLVLPSTTPSSRVASPGSRRVVRRCGRPGS